MADNVSKPVTNDWGHTLIQKSTRKSAATLVIYPIGTLDRTVSAPFLSRMRTLDCGVSCYRVHPWASSTHPHSDYLFVCPPCRDTKKYLHTCGNIFSGICHEVWIIHQNHTSLVQVLPFGVAVLPCDSGCISLMIQPTEHEKMQSRAKVG